MMPHEICNHSQPSVMSRVAWSLWSKRFLGLSAFGLCGLCACSFLEQTHAEGNLPGRSGPIISVRSEMTVRSQSADDEDIGGRGAESVTSRSQARLRPVGSRTGRTVYSSPAEMAAPVMSQSTRRTVVGGPRASTGIQQIAGENVRRVSNTNRAVERIAAEARIPANCPDAFAVGPVLDSEESCASNYPDEYICDGGDRAYPVTRDHGQMRGIEPEDTIADYQDHEGRPRVKKSNRVCIYAPRFGSVVTISGPNADTTVDKVLGHVVAQQGVGLRNREATGESHQNLATVRVQTRSRANGIGTEVGTDSFQKEVNREVGVSVINTHQQRGQLGKSEFQENLKASSAQGRLFAEHWTRKDFPVLEGHASAASQSITLRVQAEYVGLEDFGKRGDLRLLKTADRGEANIGDMVTFTIHYENRGDKELRNVVIIDNLSPRLEFEAGSVKTTRPGKHSVEDNEEGSVVLRFILENPLPGRTRGSVTFQARVK